LQANPRLKTIMGSDPPTMAAEGMKLFAVNPDTGATINVIVRPALGVRDSDVAQVAASLQAQYEKVGASVTRTATISLAGHKALRVAVRFPLEGATQQTLAEVQYFLAANDFVYILTFAGASSAFSTIISTFNIRN
jgi:hypothetical protein